MGYLHFYSLLLKTVILPIFHSRPLWGIYISIQRNYLKSKTLNYHSRPLWGIYISIQEVKHYGKRKISSRPLWGIYISIQSVR